MSRNSFWQVITSLSPLAQDVLSLSPVKELVPAKAVGLKAIFLYQAVSFSAHSFLFKEEPPPSKARGRSTSDCFPLL